MIPSRKGVPRNGGLKGCLLAVVWVVVLLLATNIAAGYAFDDSPSNGFIRELRWGAAAHDVDGLWSGESCEDGPDILAELVFNRPLFQLLAGTAYPNAGISINTRGDTSKIYGGLLLQWEPTKSIFFSTGVGLAFHDGKRDTNGTDRKSLGSNVLFRIPVEFGVAINRHHRIIIVFDHISNAGLAQPNEGLDALGVMYGYRF